MNDKKELSYGPVRIVKDRFQDLIGNYDNYSDSGKRTLVYFDVPFFSEYASIPHNRLEEAEEHEPTGEREKHD